jgi:hypothetical protein
MVRRFTELKFGLTILLPIVADLHDIDAIMKHDASVDESHSPPLIVFEKWARLKRRAVSALQFHVPFTNEATPGTAMEYLMGELQHVSRENFDLETRSQTLKMEEANIVVQMAGFQTERRATV